jgi:YCII-related domain
MRIAENHMFVPDCAPMPEITDEYMREMLQTTKNYTLVLLKAGPNKDSDTSAGIIWEHGRRNFSLRARGVLSIVCPVLDESVWSGIGIFDAEPDEVVAIMEDDPGVKAGVFEYEIHPVRSFPGDALPA